MLVVRPLPGIKCMAHEIKDKQKLINRVRRIRGQLDYVEKALSDDHECASILQTIAACRGAINGLMSEIMEDQIRCHVLDPSRPPNPDQEKAAEMLVGVVKAYLK